MTQGLEPHTPLIAAPCCQSHAATPRHHRTSNHLQKLERQPAWVGAPPRRPEAGRPRSGRRTREGRAKPHGGHRVGTWAAPQRPKERARPRGGRRAWARSRDGPRSARARPLAAGSCGGMGLRRRGSAGGKARGSEAPRDKAHGGRRVCAQQQSRLLPSARNRRELATPVGFRVPSQRQLLDKV
jgi:hypothetical protein